MVPGSTPGGNVQLLESTRDIRLDQRSSDIISAHVTESVLRHQVAGFLTQVSYQGCLIHWDVIGVTANRTLDFFECVDVHVSGNVNFWTVKGTFENCSKRVPQFLERTFEKCSFLAYR